MRESNFAFPAQNRACVCITSQLYDRRALDTNVPLPLYNSLSHLTYLTSTSPRIREIMTMDGGLERLVRILHEFCICPPPPENPAILYGLSAPSAHPTKLVPTLNPKSYDKQAAYRFSLAFQSVVNIGVRGSEQIRGRVVQAGTLEVVGCILEAWLASKGFAVGPHTTPGGMQRETKEQRMARRAAQAELRQREQAAALARALQRQVAQERTVRAVEQTSQTQEEDSMEIETPASSSGRRPSSRDTDTSTEPSSNTTPAGSNTPTGAVLVPTRDRSGTIIARPVWDQTPVQAINSHHRGRTARARLPIPSTSDAPSTSHSTDNSRPETETEDDGDVDMDVTRDSDAPVSGASSPERRNPSPDTLTIRATTTHPRRAVGIVSDAGPATAGVSLDMNTDAHIIINDQAVPVDGVGVADGIVSLETNDDFAMGAPPGAPGAINGPPLTDTHGPPGERTPRAGTMPLPVTAATPVPPLPNNLRGRPNEGGAAGDRARGGGQTPNGRATGTTNGHHHHHHHRDGESGPYRDEDVLLALQLLAYLSKYPHVRQAFYKPRPSFHPATLQQEGTASDDWWKNQAGPSTSKQSTPAPAAKDTFMKAFNNAIGRGKEKEKEKASPAPGMSPSPSSTLGGGSSQRMTNVFSLVERFTYRPSSSELDGPNPPATLPPEIQYWAGVIMRNACRKDDQQGGIRQCANMMCGRWESFPREFAKCRRCRKAKYCGKECQSIAWSEGHRFWCSAKDNEDDADRDREREAAGDTSRTNGGTSTGTVTGRAERRAARELERQARHEARVVEEFAPRQTTRAIVVGEAAPAAATPATTPTASTAAGQRPAAQGAFGTNWSFSPLTLRRARRADDGAANPNEPQDTQAVSVRYRSNNGSSSTVTVNGTADADLPPEVRQQLVQILQSGRRADRVEVTAGPSESRGQDDGPAGENDDPMIIG